MLRSLEGKNMVERYPNSIAYLARCLAASDLETLSLRN